MEYRRFTYWIRRFLILSAKKFVEFLWNYWHSHVGMIKRDNKSRVEVNHSGKFGKHPSLRASLADIFPEISKISSLEIIGNILEPYLQKCSN